MFDQNWCALASCERNNVIKTRSPIFIFTGTVRSYFVVTQKKKRRNLRMGLNNKDINPGQRRVGSLWPITNGRQHHCAQVSTTTATVRAVQTSVTKHHRRRRYQRCFLSFFPPKNFTGYQYVQGSESQEYQYIIYTPLSFYKTVVHCLKGCNTAGMAFIIFAVFRFLSCQRFERIR